MWLVKPKQWTEIKLLSLQASPFKLALCCWCKNVDCFNMMLSNGGQSIRFASDSKNFESCLLNSLCHIGFMTGLELGRLRLLFYSTKQEKATVFPSHTKAVADYEKPRKSFKRGNIFYAKQSTENKALTLGNIYTHEKDLSPNSSSPQLHQHLVLFFRPVFWGY